MEVNRRRLFAKLKYENLKDYAVKCLKYTDSEAWLRISAMQLLSEFPEIESKIKDGSLQHSNLVLAKRAFNLEEKKPALDSEPDLLSFQQHQNPTSPMANGPDALKRTKAEKLALIEKLENVSKREAVRIIAKETGVEVDSFESTRELSDGRIEMKAIIKADAFELIKLLKGRLAHKYSNLTNGELIELALKTLQIEIEPRLKNTRKATVPETAQGVSKRYIPARTKQVVWKRDNGQCTNCNSSYAVQFEHIIPFSRGGRNEVGNLKLLCRLCNQRSAIESYGMKKMSLYLKTPVAAYR